jgi:hypothetical protein
MCWWPKIIPPNLDLAGWKFPLIPIALITALGTALASEGWLSFLITSVLGGSSGIFLGFRLWPADGIDAPFIPFAIGVATLTSIPVSMLAVFAGVVLRESSIARRNPRLIWSAFLVSSAISPILVMLTPLLVSHRQ